MKQKTVGASESTDSRFSETKKEQRIRAVARKKIITEAMSMVKIMTEAMSVVKFSVLGI